MSQKIKINELVEHKDNRFYFDEITGDAWDEFIQSIKTSGVIEPVVVTQNKVIVSGHQRVRACKSLGIEEIDAEVRIFDSDDEILKCLIETNIRQRGIGNTNPVKFGRCLKELERIYGIQHGGDRSEASGNDFHLKTQKDIADELGIDVRTINNYKSLANAIPEIQTLVETGIVTPTTARAIMKKLPEFQQKELAEQFAEKGEKVSANEAEKEIRKLKDEIQDVSEERDYLKSKIEELEEREPKMVAVTKEVPPDDYEFLKKRQAEYVKEMDELTAKNKEEQKALKEQIAQLEKERETLLNGDDKAERDYAAKLKTDCIMFCTYISDFLKKTGGYMYLGREIDRLPETERKSYLSSVGLVRDWVDNMLNVTATEVIE